MSEQNGATSSKGFEAILKLQIRLTAQAPARIPFVRWKPSGSRDQASALGKSAAKPAPFFHGFIHLSQFYPGATPPSRQA